MGNKMNNDFTVLYIGTFVMLFFSLCLICFVIWATVQFSKQRKFADQRDQYYREELRDVKLLVRTEFKSVLEHLKKL